MLKVPYHGEVDVGPYQVAKALLECDDQQLIQFFDNLAMRCRRTSADDDSDMSLEEATQVIFEDAIREIFSHHSRLYSESRRQLWTLSRLLNSAIKDHHQHANAKMEYE